MLTLLYQFVLSFFASMGFGILFNAPRKALFQCGLTGAAGWIVYYIFSSFEVNQILASFVGGIVLTAVSIFNSRYMKMPIVIFITCGIIPLVPGGKAYQAMRNVVLEDYQLAFSFGIEAALIASAIALGIITSEMLYSLMNTALTKIKTGE
ncbi:threonine/serine exporter family protein [Salinicoccus sp. YB14-2]|uniref:threonine/serine exporter family protein n=1 Tax=Salinicoccus sp. YB14-2 TaxID=1572701 RepID=UPI00068F5212|nr:threonine/serine exporter family protein [Salinicoccus sp. YB14-2]